MASVNDKEISWRDYSEPAGSWSGEGQNADLLWDSIRTSRLRAAGNAHRPMPPDRITWLARIWMRRGRPRASAPTRHQTCYLPMPHHLWSPS